MLVQRASFFRSSPFFPARTLTSAPFPLNFSSVASVDFAFYGLPDDVGDEIYEKAPDRVVSFSCHDSLCRRRARKPPIFRHAYARAAKCDCSRSAHSDNLRRVPNRRPRNLAGALWTLRFPVFRRSNLHRRTMHRLQRYPLPRCRRMSLRQ